MGGGTHEAQHEGNRLRPATTTATKSTATATATGASCTPSDSLEQVVLALAGEWKGQVASQQCEEDDAEAPHIDGRAPVGGPRNQLRRKVAQGPCGGTGRLVGFHDEAEAKVSDLRAAVAGSADTRASAGAGTTRTQTIAGEFNGATAHPTLNTTHTNREAAKQWKNQTGDAVAIQVEIEHAATPPCKHHTAVQPRSSHFSNGVT